ncbi:MAG: N-acetylmuramoyl-L-alanine amidase [Lachnospiraceae bacterium]|nr:N-acetylmuramoyl-L-alanine amidase [Lachnospiraceae bacterium]
MNSTTSEKNENQKRDGNTKASMTEDVMEVKEIIERKPELQKKHKKETNKGNGSMAFVKSICVKVVSGLNELTKAIQREPKRMVWFTSAISVLLFVVVIILSVRLGGVTKELESVQAMSLGLRTELDAVKAEQSDRKVAEDVSMADSSTVTEGATLKESPLSVTVTPIPTVIPKPSATPTPEPKKYVVCVDAGHGDWDGGAVLQIDGVDQRIEKNDNLWMAKLFRDELVRLGVEVVMTREEDEYLGLTERAVIANNANADALISFHRNSFAGENEVSGVEFWLHNSKPAEACDLAEQMLASVMEVGGMVNRGVKFGSMSDLKENYEINRKANMTSMIIELGFVTSAADNAAYDMYGERYAEEMAKVVYQWLQAREKEMN